MANRPLTLRGFFAASLTLLALAGLLYGFALTSSLGHEATLLRKRPQRLKPLVPPLPNILLISVDALRPDFLGVYGSPRGASPHLDRWAAGAAVIERAYCQVPHTSFSLTSLHVGASLYLDQETLSEHPPPTAAEILATAGYQTAAFFPPAVFFIDGPLFAHYQRRRFGFHQVHYAHLDAAQRVDRILAYLKGQDRRQPFFVWAHFFDTHEPYRHRPGFTAGRRAVDRYAGEVAYVDHQLGRLLDKVAAEHPHTAVLLTADHGEEFGEMGAYYHGNSLHEYQIRVPWILRAPGLAPRRLTGPAQVIDVPVTLLALAGLSPAPSMRGHNLLPWLRGATASSMPPALSELDFKKALLSEDYALHCDYRQPPCLVYQLNRSPGTPLLQENAGASLRQTLEGQLAQALATRIPSPRAGLTACQLLLRRIKRRDPAPLPQLADACKTSAERLQLVPLLLALRSPLALEPLLLASQDPEPQVRQPALIGAARLGHSPALAQLPQILRADGLPPVWRREALIALAENGDGSAAQQLVKLLASSDDLYEQVELITLLGELRHQPAETAILARLDQLRTRLAAIQALGRLGSRRAIPALIETLHNTRYITWRRAAAQALGQFPEPRVRRALAEALREEIEPNVVLAALRSWRRVDGGQVPGLQPLSQERWRCSRGRGCTLITRTNCAGTELLLLAERRDSAAPLEVRCGNQLLATVEQPQRGALVRLASGQGPLHLQSRGRERPQLHHLCLREAR